MTKIISKSDLKSMTDAGIEVDNLKDIFSAIRGGETDFEVGNYRFIGESSIDEVMQDELASDTYTLGCCTPWFVGNMLGVSPDDVKRCQDADCMDFIGVMLAKDIEATQQGIVSADGYGGHFAHYDGNENTITGYYFFRVN